MRGQSRLSRAVSQAYQGLGTVAQELEPRNFRPRADRKRYWVDKMDLAKRLVKTLPQPLDRWSAHRATLISSELDNGRHLPILDLDGVEARLIPSSTEGNYHLYIEAGTPVPWKRYKAFLKAARDIGLITPGYYRHSVRRKATLVRPPGIYKLPNEDAILGGIYDEDDDGITDW